MFQSTKPCLCKETNGSYSNAVIGILVIVVLVIITASILGCGGYIVNKKDFNFPIDLGLNQDNIRNKNVVPIAQRRDFTADTDLGTIDIYNYNLPTTVPVCIDDDTVADWLIQVNVTGGYIPYDGYVKLYQYKEGFCEIGKIKLVWTPDETGCCWQTYNVTFDVIGCIHVDSNHFPWRDDANGWFLDPKAPNADYTLGKEVTLKLVTKWKGCDDEYQKFEIILAHLKFISGAPNSQKGKNRLPIM